MLFCAWMIHRSVRSKTRIKIPLKTRNKVQVRANISTIDDKLSPLAITGLMIVGWKVFTYHPTLVQVPRTKQNIKKLGLAQDFCTVLHWHKYIFTFHSTPFIYFLFHPGLFPLSFPSKSACRKKLHMLSSSLFFLGHAHKSYPSSLNETFIIFLLRKPPPMFTGVASHLGCPPCRVC